VLDIPVATLRQGARKGSTVSRSNELSRIPVTEVSQGVTHIDGRYGPGIPPYPHIRSA